MRYPWPLVLTCLTPLAACAAAAPVAADLAATYREGQVFLTWSEQQPTAETRFTVYQSAAPITSLDHATALAPPLAPGSAADWWLNPETYGKPAKPDAEGHKPDYPHEGFLIVEGGPRLAPDSGLYVHTVAAESAGDRYYAVVDESGVIRPGVNATTAAVHQQVAPPQPIWQNDPAEKPQPGAGDGLPLDLTLHAKTGQGGKEWLAFGDGSLGWREGLPFKFGAGVAGEAVYLTPTDRTWIGRMFTEGRDNCQKLTPAIHTFWFGYQERIHEPEGTPPGRVIAYTERRLLWLLDWTKEYLGTDPNRTYCRGGSMGGCGTMSFALHHPEIFAAIHAHVPIVHYAAGDGGDSLFRISAETGGPDNLCLDGQSVDDRLNSTKFATEHPGELPFLFISNGRTDGSIPWWQNPPFYRAMRDGHHGLVAAWNTGDHGGCGRLLPADFNQRASFGGLHRFALNQSYLAITNLNTDDDPGQGGKDDGDPIGYFGRGLEHDPPVETLTGYEVTLHWYLDAPQLPVTADLTPRRLQQFKVEAGKRYRWTIETAGKVQSGTAQADANGLLTLTKVPIAAAEAKLTIEPLGD